MVIILLKNPRNLNIGIPMTRNFKELIYGKFSLSFV